MGLYFKRLAKVILYPWFFTMKIYFECAEQWLIILLPKILLKGINQVHLWLFCNCILQYKPPRGKTSSTELCCQFPTWKVFRFKNLYCKYAENTEHSATFLLSFMCSVIIVLISTWAGHSHLHTDCPARQTSMNTFTPSLFHYFPLVFLGSSLLREFKWHKTSYLTLWQRLREKKCNTTQQGTWTTNQTEILHYIYTRGVQWNLYVNTVNTWAHGRTTNHSFSFWHRGQQTPLENSILSYLPGHQTLSNIFQGMGSLPRLQEECFKA